MFWVGIEAGVFWVVFSAALLGGALWEMLWPWRIASKQLTRRWRNHGLIILLSSVAGMLTYRVSLVMVAVAVSHSRFGLLNRPWLPLVVRCALCFVLLDLVRYGLHRAFHAFPLLWRVHQVHHSDPELDLSTGVRNHPLESLGAQAVLLAVTAVIAPPPVAVLAMELIAVVQAFFTHANANLPVWMERPFGMVFITPQMHRVHHSEEMREQTSNFGEVFPWWDRLFGTLLSVPKAGFENMQIGLKGHQTDASAGLVFMLAQPFRSVSVEQPTFQEPLPSTVAGD